MPRTPKQADATVATTPARRRPTAKRRTEKRLTSRDMVERLFELASDRHQPRSTVKLAEGPRGQVMVDVVVQAGDKPEALAVASALAQAEFDRLRAKYHAAGMPGSDQLEG
jgi:hypothetical protein